MFTRSRSPRPCDQTSLVDGAILLGAGAVAGLVGSAGGITSLLSYPALLAGGPVRGRRGRRLGAVALDISGRLRESRAIPRGRGVVRPAGRASAREVGLARQEHSVAPEAQQPGPQTRAAGRSVDPCRSHDLRLGGEPEKRQQDRPVERHGLPAAENAFDPRMGASEAGGVLVDGVDQQVDVEQLHLRGRPDRFSTSTERDQVAGLTAALKVS